MVGAVTAACAWLLLATHFCVDVGGAHAGIAPAPAHSEAEPHAADSGAHPECALALWASPDRDPASAPLEPEALPEAAGAIVAIAMPVQQAVPLPPGDIGRAGSAPLYLLHATFLI